MAGSGPDTTSSDFEAMKPYWTLVSTLLAGPEAMRIAGETYLPKFPQEDPKDYDYRRQNGKFTNIYADIVSNLAAKPFTEKLALQEKTASPQIEALAEDIDGRGNNLHVFASAVFFDGINNAIDWILVDFTSAPMTGDVRPRTVAEERDQGLRPYWVHVPATRMLAVYSDTINGKEEIVHARIQENLTRRDGYGEITVERVRVFNRERFADGNDKTTGYGPATFEVFEKSSKGEKVDWTLVDGGAVTIGIIPLVPFLTGRRRDGGWRLVPPMRDAAYLQVEHYQAETGLKSIKELTAFPMLAGNGVMLPDNGVVPVGPRGVVTAPPWGDTGNHGEWKWIEPSAESLKFLADDCERIETQLRELGRQPMTISAGITVVAAAYASQKASSAIQAWAFGLKDALEQALKITALWLNDASQPVVNIFTDFALEAGDEKGPDVLLKMRETGDLSQETLWEESRRRGILSPDFDPEVERKRLLDETPDPDTEADLDDALPDREPAPKPDPDDA